MATETWGDVRRAKGRVMMAGALALLAVAVALLAWTIRRPAPPVHRLPDYSVMLQYYPAGSPMKMPSPEQLQKLASVWPTVPPEQNAAFYYMKGVSLLRTNGVPPGAVYSFSEPFAGDVAAVEDWIRANTPGLKLIRTGHGTPVCQFPVFRDPQGIFTDDIVRSSLFRYACNVMTDAGFLAELRNDPDAAAECYLDCLRLGRRIKQCGMLGLYVKPALDATGAVPLARLLDNCTLRDDMLRRIIAECRASETTDDDSRAAVTRALAIYDVSTQEVTGLIPSLRARWDRRSLVALLRDLDRPPARRQYVDLIPSMDVRAMRVYLRQMALRAALALYRNGHGAWPDHLDRLVPDILPSVPVDEFDGRPMRYVVDANGWRVWSVGRNLKDDGGSTETECDARTGIPCQKDIVEVGARTASNLNWRTRSRIEVPAQDQYVRNAARLQGAADRDALGLTPLHRAANSGDVGAAKGLLAQGAQANARGFANQTPLHLATTGPMAELLLSSGAEVDPKDLWGRTPLFWAAGAGRKEVVVVLIARGAAPGAKETEPVEKESWTLPARTPAERARNGGHEDVARMIEQGVGVVAPARPAQ